MYVVLRVYNPYDKLLKTIYVFYVECRYIFLSYKGVRVFPGFDRTKIKILVYKSKNTNG